MLANSDDSDVVAPARELPMCSLSSIFDDLRDRLVKRLERDGLAVPDDARSSVQRALVAYLRVVHRSIRPRKRQVHWSKELGARLLIMSDDARASLMQIASEVESGEDVNQRLTRRHFKAGFNDRLLNDLGVYHFHLGPRDGGLDKTGRHVMSGGGDDLLWAVVRENASYFIELLPHRAFATFDFAKVIYDNWTFLLGPPVEGCSVDEDDAFSAEVRARFRNAGLFTLVSFNGQAFIPGGFMNDGTSSAVVRTANASLNRVTDIYRWIEANIEGVVDGLKARALRPVRLRLMVADLDDFLRGRVSLVEQESGFAFHADSRGIRVMAPQSR